MGRSAGPDEFPSQKKDGALAVASGSQRVFHKVVHLDNQ